jgi:hypothetical protein
LVVCGLLSVVNLCNELVFFNVLANICMGDDCSVAWGTQDARPVPVGLTGIRVRAAAKVDASERVTASRLDHGLTVHSGFESGTEANVKRGRVADGFGRMFGHAPVYDNGGMKEFRRDTVRVHQHRDLLFAEHVQDAQAVGRIGDAAGSDALNVNFPGVNCFGKRDGAAHGQRLGEFGDDHAQAGTNKSDGDAGCEVPAAADEDKGGHDQALFSVPSWRM